MGRRFALRFAPQRRIMQLLAAMGIAALSQPVTAQSGGFVATLGADTVQVEHFARRGDRVDGTVVTRAPVTRVITWSMTYGPGGEPVRYEVATRSGNGTQIQTAGATGSMTFLADSVVRETFRDGATVAQRIAAPGGVAPAPGLPYLGVSYLMWELAFSQARRRADSAGRGALQQLTMIPSQLTPQRTQVWFVGTDSAEASYFSIAKSGYRFDEDGRLIRSDWTATTVRYRIVRVPSIDVEAIARAWTTADFRGAGMGAFSPRDTTRATLGDASLTVDYSRPSKRGRRVWGEVVPWGRVWRLGADYATHFTTSHDLVIGDALLPAGSYTLWMLAKETGDSKLIINRQTGIFGTQYNPARDFVRVTLNRSQATEIVERLTIAVEGDALWIRWDDQGWSVPISVKH